MSFPHHDRLVQGVGVLVRKGRPRTTVIPVGRRRAAKSNGPQAWNPVLEIFRKIFPTAIIGGGAVRDHLLNQCPNDLDVFVAFEGDKKALAALLQQHGLIKNTP